MKQKVEKKGALGKNDFIQEQKSNDGLYIYPYYERCQKAASYDITPTIVAMSVKTGMLEKVYKESREKVDKCYIHVHPKDTVLIVSNEYLRVPRYMAGYVSSRVSKVVEGFGHISTTIDPNWSGAALIAVSNPSNQLLKIYVGADISGENVPNQLATVTFHYLNTPCENDDKDAVHKGMRLDLLNKVSYHNKHGIRALFRKYFYRRRKAFTDYFFACTERLEEGYSEQQWGDFLNDFSFLTAVVPEDDKFTSKKARKIARSFIISENIFTRLCYFLSKYRSAVIVIFVIIMFILWQIGIIPNETVQTALSVISSGAFA